MTREELAIRRIKEQLNRLEPFLPGSISKQFNVCGNPTCRCKDPKHPQRHGPYFQLSYTVNGRSSTRFIKTHELDEARRRLRRFRLFKRLNARLVDAYIALARKQGL
ncbi:MAG: DUF6788 family protein [Planctomycetota bacterium]